MAKQKKDFGLIVWAFGWLLDLATRLRKLVTKLNVPFEAFERLTSDEGEATLGRVLTLIRADYIASLPNLPPNHYRVHVTYAPLPSFADLKKEYGENNVSVIFDGRPFTLHASCRRMDRTPGEKTFYIHETGSNWDTEELIAWGLKQRGAIAPNGYRPATHEEIYEFSNAHPELADFVGLGSYAMESNFGYVAYIVASGSRRCLTELVFSRGQYNRNRVLFVAI